MNIRIDRNKKGKKIAYEVRRDGRNIRTNLEAAELMISTGAAASVTYGPNPFGPGVKYVGEGMINGIKFYNTSFVVL